MREILFRAKDYRTGQWVYGIYFKNPVSRFNEGAYYPQIIPEIHGVHDTIERCSIVEDTLGQYTGLIDKNGVKIFEGDIVLKRTYQGKKPFPVAYHDGMFHCGWGGGSSTATHGYTLADKQIEVIGNVYDNPELLRGDDKND